MKIEKFNETSEFQEIKIPPDLQDFVEWCLLTKKYFYDSDLKGWYTRKALTKVSWDELYSHYFLKKYNL